MRRVVPDGFYDGVLAWDSLFYLKGDEQAALIEKIGNWLAPGGRLLFNTTPAKGMTFGQEWVNEPLDPESYRQAFVRGELVEIDHKPSDAAAGGRSIWYARKP